MADRKAELERKKERLRQMREEKERRRQEKEKQVRRAHKSFKIYFVTIYLHCRKRKILKRN
jgi:hypothetical protein